MFDHVTIRVSDRGASRAFYELALGALDLELTSSGDHFDEWWDFSISEARADRPVTRNLHAAFVARSRHAVDEWWGAMTGAGYRDDGAPGPRPQYSPDYYGAFVLDPDGNSVEAVHYRGLSRDENRIAHLWIRARELDESRRFYETIARVAGLTVRTTGLPGVVSVSRQPGHFCLVEDERPVTENLHFAFPGDDNGSVDEFHRVAVEAGYRDNGAPGERPEYHAGYYGAFVLDPDGNNVEVVCHNRD